MTDKAPTTDDLRELLFRERLRAFRWKGFSLTLLVLVIVGWWPR